MKFQLLVTFSSLFTGSSSSSVFARGVLQFSWYYGKTIGGDHIPQCQSWSVPKIFIKDKRKLSIFGIEKKNGVFWLISKKMPQSEQAKENRTAMAQPLVLFWLFRLFLFLSLLEGAAILYSTPSLTRRNMVRVFSDKITSFPLLSSTCCKL